MNTKTRIVSLILSLAMLVTLAAGLDFSAFADDTRYVDGYYTYTVSDGKATIISCDSKISGDVVIPSLLGGYPVTNFGDGSFFFCDNMINVTLPKSVESLDGNVFDDCEKLENIFVKNGNKAYTSLNGVLFSKDKTVLVQYPVGNPRLSYIIPDGVKYIKEMSFKCCPLVSVAIPKSVEKVEGGAFLWCYNLANVYYAGSSAEWQSIDIGFYDNFENSKVYYDYDMPTPAQVQFTDLKPFQSYDEYVLYTSINNSFILGTNPPKYTEFSPKMPISRAMFVVILYRMAGNPYDDCNPYTSSPFTDIGIDAVMSYYYNAACWALDKGITTETTFKPFDNVTREQTASFLFRYAKDNGNLGDGAYKNVDLTSYPDYNSVHGWAAEAVQWANYNGMITGTQQGYINPQGATQRIHATKILYGFGKACNIGNFA